MQKVEMIWTKIKTENENQKDSVPNQMKTIKKLETIKTT